MGRIPPPGYDGVVADVPCTGSATSRKNRNVWWKWSPKESRTLFRLQVEITTRGANLLRPGGKLVYSTCSIDPCENEAVVAQLLRDMPFLELLDVRGVVHKELLVSSDALEISPAVREEVLIDHQYTRRSAAHVQEARRREGPASREGVRVDKLVWKKGLRSGGRTGFHGSETLQPAR